MDDIRRYLVEPFSFLANRSRQRALLRLLAAATEKQIPLVPMLDAFADDAVGSWRNDVHRLAGLLRSGLPLAEALDQVPQLLPPDVMLAVRLGMESGAPGPALRAAVRTFAEHDQAGRPTSRGDFAYLWILLLVLIGVVNFLMYWIIPKFKKIFEDFGSELPDLTVAVIEVSDFVMHYFYLFGPALFLLFWATLAIAVNDLLSALDVRPLSLFGWMFPRRTMPDFLRNLSVVVEAGRPLSGAVSTMGRYYRSAAFRRRLLYIRNEVEQGVDLWDCLTKTGLLRASETTLLESARRAGNLPWALRAVADKIARGHLARIRTLLEIGRSTFVILIGVVVGFVFAGFFLPLIKLISEFS